MKKAAAPKSFIAVSGQRPSGLPFGATEDGLGGGTPLPRSQAAPALPRLVLLLHFLLPLLPLRGRRRRGRRCRVPTTHFDNLCGVACPRKVDHVAKKKGSLQWSAASTQARVNQRDVTPPHATNAEASLRDTTSRIPVACLRDTTAHSKAN